jgi:hypothetical protein
VHALGPEAGLALQMLDAMTPRFCVWDWNRRTKNAVAIEQPAQVTPHLLIGDVTDATVDTCRRCNCAAVVVTCHVSGKYLHNLHAIGHLGIKVLKLDCVHDTDEFDIIEAFFTVYAWMAGFLRLDKKVLVVSWNGINRSAAFVTGLMVFHYKYSLVSAVRHLTEQRGVVLTNRKFRFLLVKACVEYGQPLGARPQRRSARNL